MRWVSPHTKLKQKMEDIKRKFLENCLLGVIKFKDSYDFYLMPIAWWILNYRKYDPEYEPSNWEAEYRNNILNVTDGEIENFVKAIEVDRLTVEDVISAISAIPPEYTRIVFLLILIISYSSVDFMILNWKGIFLMKAGKVSRETLLSFCRKL